MFTWLIDNIIGNIPVWAWTAVAGAGAAGYVISGLIAKMPFAQAKALALLVKIVGILAVVGGIFMCGGSGVLAIEQNAIKEMQDKVAKAELASADANAKLDDALKNKTKTIHDTQYIVQQKIVHDAAQMDATCVVDPVAISDLNQAAGGKK